MRSRKTLYFIEAALVFILIIAFACIFFHGSRGVFEGDSVRAVDGGPSSIEAPPMSAAPRLLHSIVDEDGWEAALGAGDAGVDPEQADHKSPADLDSKAKESDRSTTASIHRPQRKSKSRSSHRKKGDSGKSSKRRAKKKKRPSNRSELKLPSKMKYEDFYPKDQIADPVDPNEPPPKFGMLGFGNNAGNKSTPPSKRSGVSSKQENLRTGEKKSNHWGPKKDSIE